MVTVKDIISKIDFDEVFEEYKKHYTEDRKSVECVFEQLKNSNALENIHNMVLFITAIKENKFGDDVVVDQFSCDDETIFFDVSGRDDDYDGLYSIASSSYEELLGYLVSDKTLTNFTSQQIISHILWALDW